MDKEAINDLREALDELAAKEETPEMRRERYKLYVDLGMITVVGIAIFAMWALFSQALSLSSVLPHCITLQNAAPVCK